MALVVALHCQVMEREERVGHEMLFACNRIVSNSTLVIIETVPC